MGYVLVFLAVSLPCGWAFYLSEKLAQEEQAHAETQRMLDGWIDRHERARTQRPFTRGDL